MILSSHSQWTNRFSRHRKGFFSLCIFELLSRYAFYMMLGVLIIYVPDKEHGLGLSIEEASRIYGTYLAIVFFTPVFGGTLATRWLGLRRAILVGGLLFALGLVLVGVRDVTSFYLGLGLLCLGNGLTRPGISLLVGNLYPTKDERHDSAFSVLFFFINTGAFIAFIAASPIRNRLSWQWVFWLGAIGMVSGLLVLVANWRRLEPGDLTATYDPKKEKDLAAFTKKLLLPAVVSAGLGYALSMFVTVWPCPCSGATTAVVFGMVPVIVFLVSLLWQVTEPERPSIHALLIVFLAAATFFSILHMHGSALTIWAKDKTDRVVSWVPCIWTRDAEPGYFALTGAANDPGQPGYVSSMPSSNGAAPRVVDPEVYQSWNPFWVMVFTPLVVVLFRRRESSGRAISTARKIFYGLMLTTLSMFLMEVAAWVYELDGERVSGLWLVGTYCILTLGEVFLTPMGQSIVTKLAPERFSGVLIGGWYCSMAIGNVISGFLGEAHTKLPPRTFFLLLTVAMGLVAALFWKLLPKLDQALS